MSLKAKTWSSQKTILTGISFRMILSKIVYVLIPNTLNFDKDILYYNGANYQSNAKIENLYQVLQSKYKLSNGYIIGIQSVIFQKIEFHYQSLKLSNLHMKTVQFDSIDTQQIANYLKSRVLPILEPLQMDILEQRPSNIKHFAFQWLQSFKEDQNKKDLNQEDDEEPEEVFKQKIKRKKQKQKQGRSGFRVGVSGESTSSLNFQKLQQMQENQTFIRTEQTKIKILIQLRNSILFKNLSHNSLLKIIERMKPVQFSAGEVVIKQGDDGNELFIVDEGFFKCIFVDKKCQQKVYGPGEAFGELALLYNTKRASTIIAETDGRLYLLGRLQFNTVLRENVLKKAQMCDKILNNIQIFQTMDRYQKSKIYEALQEIEVAAGKYIIKEGQLGDCFYIVAEGKLVAQKLDDGQLKPVYYYKQGDYFGELAILKNIVRQASVKALTKVRLLYIERSSFKRLLGSIQNILRRNEARYKNSPKRTKRRKVSVDKQNDTSN